MPKKDGRFRYEQPKGYGSPEWVIYQLYDLAPLGAGADNLLKATPELVKKLCLMKSPSGPVDTRQAEVAERRMGEAIDALDDINWDKPLTAALRYIFALSDESEVNKANLRIRVERASLAYGVQYRYFRSRYYDEAIVQLSWIIYYKLTRSDDFSYSYAG